MSNHTKIKKELSLKSFGQKGWLKGNDIECPDCKRADKFGVRLTNNGGVAYCFYCHKAFGLFTILKKLKKLHLLDRQTDVSDFNLLEGFEVTQEAHISDLTDIREIKKPIGYKYLKEGQKYLTARHFNAEHYKAFKPGQSSLHPHLDKSYIVFLLYQHKKLVGWLARSQKEKSWHDKNLKEFKDGKAQLKLRYRNDSESQFSKIVGGFDEITENTHTVIITEGIFDKVNVDTQLDLHLSEDIKCLFTFGDGVTEFQAQLIGTTNVKKVYVMYDYNTIEESKHAGGELIRWIEDVNICRIKQKGADPGDLNAKKILDLLENSENFLYFHTNTFSLNFRQ